MFDDPKKELEELEKKLLSPENDEWLDKQLAEAHALMGDLPNAAPRPQDQPRVLPSQQKKKKKVDFLNILIIVELLGIAGIAAYWAVMLLG